MAKCSQCGAELHEGAKFCEICGAKVEEQPQKLVCPKCGQELEPGSQFCYYCGAKLGEEPNAQPEQMAKPEPQPQPQPQPAPQPYPQPQQGYPQPQPTPAPNQPYYGPQPGFQPQPAPNQQAPRRVSTLQLVRSLVMNIGLFLVYLLLLLPLVVPFVNGLSDNYFSYMSEMFNFSGVEDFYMVLKITNLGFYLLPAIGFLSYGTIALVNGIQSLIRKETPRYDLLGGIFGMYAPFFAMLLCPTNASNGVAGFSFTVFESPSFVLFFVAFILYVLIGLTGSYLNAFEEKKGLTAPIMKSVAVVLGILMVTFSFGAVIAQIAGSSQMSYSPMVLYSSSAGIIQSGGDTSPIGSLFFAGGIFYAVSLIFMGSSMGELFSPTRRRSQRINTIVFTSIHLIFCSLALVMYYSISGSSGYYGMPSVIGFVVLFLAIAFMVFANIAASKEKPIAIRPTYMPQTPNYY